jgi:hypothetical protein
MQNFSLAVDQQTICLINTLAQECHSELFSGYRYRSGSPHLDSDVSSETAAEHFKEEFNWEGGFEQSFDDAAPGFEFDIDRSLSDPLLSFNHSSPSMTRHNSQSDNEWIKGPCLLKLPDQPSFLDTVGVFFSDVG